MITAVFQCSAIIRGMGKAGQALKQVLESRGISQSSLATALEVDRPIVHRWFHGQVDPTAETVATIVETLRSLNPDAAEEFISLYLGTSAQASSAEVSVISSQRLPASEQVNIAALARLFGDKTNSYKYLFFLSLLDILRRRHFEVLSSISFEELIVEMLANAWFPHTFFKLSFGTQDKIAQKLEALNLIVEEPIIQLKDADKKLLRKAITARDLKDTVSHLRRYVPFRLIAPFVESALGEVSRGKGNQLELAMPAIAEQCFEIHKPLYRFDSTQHKDCQAIFVHPDWASYLEKHYAIVRGWAAWEWLTFMQRRNPSTPAIANKLFMPTKRDSLEKQAKYWRSVLSSREIICIYSKKPLQPTKFSLDHYLPWSFLAHDQLWNLIPTSPEINSAKSNKIPSSEYFDAFVNSQYLGLQTTYSLTLDKSRWAKTVESYLTDLGISDVMDLLNLENLRQAYRKTIKPLEALAENQGFSPGWLYSKVDN